MTSSRPVKAKTAAAVPPGYGDWLAEVKARVHAAQQRAALAVNRELLVLYWEIGRDILDRQQRAGWGAGIVDKLSADLRSAFPAMKGFSRANLMSMRVFAEAWPADEIVQQPVGQLPWGHNLALLSKLKDREARLAYASSALEHGWSRAVLVHHLEARTVERTGKAITNFAERLTSFFADRLTSFEHPHPRPLSRFAGEGCLVTFRWSNVAVGTASIALVAPRL